MQTGKDHWEVLCRARAIETQAYVCAPAQTGAHFAGKELRQTYGHSLIADPWGHVIAKASDGIGIVSTRIDRALVKKFARKSRLRNIRCNSIEREPSLASLGIPAVSARRRHLFYRPWTDHRDRDRLCSRSACPHGLAPWRTR